RVASLAPRAAARQASPPSLHDALPISCAEAHSNLGVLFAEEGLREEALEEFRRAVALRPDSSESHFNLGWALLCEDELCQAEATLQESVRLDPGNVEGLYALALLHQRTGAYARAVEALKQAIERRPDDA